MNDFLYYISVFTLPLSAIIGTIYNKKTKNTPLKYLVFYLWFVIFVELVAYFLAVKYRNNIWWYNITSNLEKIFYLSLFYQYISNTTVKKLLIFSAVVFELFFIVFYIFYSENWSFSQSFANSFGGLLVIIAIFIFLIELFQSDKVLYMQEYMIFWVSIGLLIYMIVAMPLNITYYYLQREGSSLPSLLYIQHIVNIIMYPLFIYGYIWSKKQYK